MSDCENCEDLERINSGLIKQIRVWRDELDRLKDKIDHIKMEMYIK